MIASLDPETRKIEKSKPETLAPDAAATAPPVLSLSPMADPDHTGALADSQLDGVSGGYDSSFHPHPQPVDPKGRYDTGTPLPSGG